MTFRVKLLILFFGVSGLLFAQTPTVSNVAVTNISHASVNITFTVSTPSFVQIKYGVASGNYPYISASYYTNSAALSIGGLQPGTTYYFVPAARPNADNDTNICQASACGAGEQTFTTAPAPALHPDPPAAPAVWQPVEPDTSAYTVVPMQVSGTTGACVAASNVAQQSNWNAAVSAGDDITAILGKVNFGTVIELPQGVSCKVLQTNAYFHNGYELPPLAIDSLANGNIDSPNHRWIVFRTAKTAASDFPPFGVRTGPLWAAKMAKFIIQTPGMPTPLANYTGQVFDCYGANCHHFWIENIEFTVLADSTIYPPGARDPVMYSPFVTVNPAGSAPSYIVLDRLYMHTPPPPARQWTGIELGGDHTGVISSWIDINYWRLGRFPTANPATLGSGNTVLTIPQQTWGFNYNDNPIGMSTPATATLAAPSGYSGNFVGCLGNSGTNGLTIQYTSGSASIACSNCTAAAVPTPSCPFNTLQYFLGSIAGGQFSLGFSLPTNPPTDGTTWYPPWKPLGIYILPGNFRTFDNNFIEAPGQGVYDDPDGLKNDLTFTHNHLYFPRSKMQNSGQWDGYGYTFRNEFESKQGLRWKIEGNLFDGSAAYQNSGAAILVVGSAPGTGTQDYSIRNNIFRHLAAGFSCAGGGGQAPPDAPTTRRVDVGNNLWLDLNRDLYNNGGSGLMSGFSQISPGCEDVNIHNNTVDLDLGIGPAILLLGSASNGATVVGEGLNLSNNIVHLSLNALDAVWSQCGQQIASHPAFPAAICSGTGATYKQMLDAFFVRAGATVTPNYTFTHNLILGGETKRAINNWADLDQGTINNLIPSFPAGNIWPTGSTLATRRNNIKWDAKTFRVQSSKWNAGDIGANVDTVQSAVGIVSNIGVQPSINSAQFSYTAPDARSCSVDVAADGTNWTRTTDSGGGRDRTLLVSQLSAGSSYQYRILCYFEQLPAYEFLPNQLTDGTFKTGAAAARSASLGFSLASVPGAVQTKFTLAPLGGGTTIQQTCSASPCTIQIAAGSYQRQEQFFDKHGKLLSTSDKSIVVIP